MIRYVKNKCTYNSTSYITPDEKVIITVEHQPEWQTIGTTKVMRIKNTTIYQRFNGTIHIIIQ